MTPVETLRRTLRTSPVKGRELFAAAGAGQPAAVDKVVGFLRPDSIDRRDSAPSDMAPLVEAVAAHHRPTLAGLTKQWPDPADVAGHPWYEAAWTAALRHIDRSRLGRSPHDVDFLDDELALIGDGVDDPRPWSWFELPTGNGRPFVDLDLRALARRPCTNAAIDAAALATAPMRALRALRGRFDLLDSSARRFLVAIDPDPVEDPYGIAVLLEASRDLGLGLATPIAERVNHELSNGTTSWSMFDTVLTLMSDWVVP